MANIKFISKKPAGGLGNFNYTYLCTCGNGKSQNISFSAANDMEANSLAENICGESCNEEKSELSTSLQIPSIDYDKSLETIRPLKSDLQIGGTYVNYSFYDDVYWNGDQLWGNWSQSLSVVCSGQAINGFYFKIQLVRDPEVVEETCSGKYVLRIETRD